MKIQSSIFKFVDEQVSLDEALACLSTAEKIAVDTEADSRHRYPEKVCLIQLSDGEHTYVIDTLASLDYSGLDAVFADGTVCKVLHGADFDIRGINRDFGFGFAHCYDTSIAARFAGFERLGLAALLEEILGVSIPKDQRLQRADWSRRPLETAALDYAATDVIHLVALRDALDERLSVLGRDRWVREEFDRLADIRYVAPDPDFAFLSVKGTRDLDGRALAVLNTLFAFREIEALRLNRPPGYVIAGEALAYLSANPASELEEVPGLGPAAQRRYGRGIKKAVSAGLNALPIERPRSAHQPLPRPNATQAARLSKLKRWRIGIGETLRVDPSILWPMRSLERLSRQPTTFHEEIVSADVRSWQRECFADELQRQITDET